MINKTEDIKKEIERLFPEPEPVMVDAEKPKYFEGGTELYTSGCMIAGALRAMKDLTVL